MPQSNHSPNWIEQPAPPDSYRSLFKWGDPLGFRHPNRGMLALVKETFGMTDADFAEPKRVGMEQINLDAPVPLDPTHLRAFERIAGAENVNKDSYARL